MHQKKHEDKRSLKELQLMENLFSKDDVIPKDFSSENEEEYFRLLNNKESGKAITNISEFLLE